MVKYLTTQTKQSDPEKELLIINCQQEKSTTPILCSFDSNIKQVKIHSEKDIEIIVRFYAPKSTKVQDKDLKLKFMFKAKRKNITVTCETLDTTEDFEYEPSQEVIERQSRSISSDDKAFKTHYGRVSKLFKECNYGIISTSDNQQIYFHRDSFDDDSFDQITENTRLKFLVTEGILGMQAIHIRGITVN